MERIIMDKNLSFALLDFRYVSASHSQVPNQYFVVT
jgi:hypothetical protein